MVQAQDSNDPTGVVAEHPGKDVVRARDRKANAAIQLRTAGASWEEIAETLGYPTARMALVATEKALEKQLQTTESQTAMRSLAGRRQARQLVGVWKKATNPEDPEHLAAVAKARELVAQHTKLYGLDAPTEMVVHTPSQQELETWVAQVTKQAQPELEEGDIFEADWEEEAPPAEAG